MTDDSSQLHDTAVDDLLLRLRTQLAAALPGLSDADLDALAGRTRTELELRVPEALAADLEHDDEWGLDFDHWYHSNKSACRVTSAIVTARLIAEVVEAVATADPTSIQGSRGIVSVVPLSLDVIEGWLVADGRQVDRWERAVVTFVGCRKPVNSMLIAIGLWPDSGPSLLTLTGFARDLQYPEHQGNSVRDFVTAWNAGRTTDRSSTIVEAEFTGLNTISPEHCEVTGEVRTLMPAEASRDYVLAVIDQAAAAMEAMFERLAETVAPPARQSSTDDTVQPRGPPARGLSPEGTTNTSHTGTCD